MTCVGCCRVPGDRRRVRAGKLRFAGHRGRVALGRRQHRGVRWKHRLRDAVWARRRSRPGQPTHPVTAHSRSTSVMLNISTTDES